MARRDGRDASGPRNWPLRVGITCGLLLVCLTASFIVRSRIDDAIAVESGDWRLWLQELPPWFPTGYRGSLVELDRLPETLSLRPPWGRDRLRSALEQNPWIDAVTSLERDGERIRFRARFARPIVGVRTVTGFALLDDDGRIIDSQPGGELYDEWRIPLYLPDAGVLDPPPRPGTLLGSEEFVELVSLLDVLWEARVFDRWPGVIRDLVSEPAASGGRLWIIRLRNGIEAAWGRAPASPHLSPLSSRARLENLRRVLSRWQDLASTRDIELWTEKQPVVVDRR